MIWTLLAVSILNHRVNVHVAERELPSRKYRLNMTMRETQRVMISRAVQRTEDGLKMSSRWHGRSAVRHPMTPNSARAFRRADSADQETL